MAAAQLEGRRIRMSGTVQGVGFRPWVYRIARRAGVTGRVRNDGGGVTIDAFGDGASLAGFIEMLQSPPPAARVERFDLVAIEPERASRFEIVRSESGLERQVSIPPDLAICRDCLAEIFDPAERRYRYPFTNCTNCGPRFTIATDIPYDRAATTMAAFTMCPACQREYDDPADRRFHAQPNACPLCGPSVALHAHDGVRIGVDDPIASAGETLEAGLIVALKGLGGFHLACDATSDEAVRVLRLRKRRDEKPFAVMVRTLGEAEALADIDERGRRLIESVERPIVLLPKRRNSTLAPSVAPGNRLVGIMLAYSPLHHLLLADARRPLVMTSGNLSDEPIAYRNDEAVSRLGAIADLFLLHDREIETRCDDSVATVIAGGETVIRRSRGYVPRAITVGRRFERPVLACGALLKNTFCLADGQSAWLGPHIGDLENVDTYDAYVDAIGRMERFLAIRPEVVAHDMHPDYLSTWYAAGRTRSAVAVQHHHAHVVSVMAEHGLEGPVVGIAYDGTGYGTDGTMWGGEILVATRVGFRRAVTFRALPLVGGDQAIREPWRIALSLVLDAFDGELPPYVRGLFAAAPDASRSAPALPKGFEIVQELIRQKTATAHARGVGRYFDGFGALFLGRARSTFEGQVALEWNQTADPHGARSYQFRFTAGGPCPEVDLRPAVRDAIRDHAAGTSVGTIAAAFHNTLVEATAAGVAQVVKRVGRLPIVASGGCFQNARLAEGVRDRLAPEHELFFNRVVPPGDGGIALGQAVVADAIARRSDRALEGKPCVWEYQDSSPRSTS
jgi:hydrogenase maturation protein HypF